MGTFEKVHGTEGRGAVGKARKRGTEPIEVNRYQKKKKTSIKLLPRAKRLRKGSGGGTIK